MRLKRTGAVCIAAALCAAAGAWATVPSVTINVPHKLAPKLEIAKLKVSVSVATDTPVTFQITHAGGSGSLPAVTTNALSPGAADCFPGGGCFFAYSGGGGLPDNISVTVPPSATAAGDPARRKYTFLFNLNANIDLTCASHLTADEQWTIAVTTGPQIDGVCAQSLDQATPGVGTCTTLVRPVPQPEGIATVTGLAANLQGCRVGLDCILVLDRSGSMKDPVFGGGMPKINRLRESVTNFINQWQILRDDESMVSASPPTLSPADQVGVVFFDTTAQWLKEINGTSITPLGIGSFSTVKSDILANVPGVPTANFTSIGGGLKKAAESFTGVTDTNRKVILLMSDGMQNQDPMAQVSGTQVQTTVGGVATNLVNQPTLQIYSLTVGSGAMVDPTINQAIATASNGFYMNTETDSTILPSLFVQLLQNFVHYSTFETLRLVSDEVSRTKVFQTTIPVTSTTQSIVFNLTWEARSGGLRLTVSPPNGAPPIVRSGGPGGFLTINQVLPDHGRSPMGDWGVLVEAENVELGSVPFDLIVLGDDAALSSELGPVTAQYRPGDRIVVHARVRELEQTMKTLGSAPGDRLVVRLLQPGAGIGDLLSTSTASSTPPPGPDKMSPAEAKLFNMLTADPSALKKNEGTLTLVDDGSAAAGDDVAGDGVYSAAFTAELEGHYYLLFGVEGQTKSLGRFSRQQLRTVHVKPSADAGNTTFNQQIKANVLVIVMTPRTRTNHRLGPGWGPYFWFESRSGAVRPQDNLDGTYTVNIPFAGGVPPRVVVHFIDDPVKIPDDVQSPSQLPVKLGKGNVLVDPLPGSGFGGHLGPAAGGFRVFLDLGPNFPHGDFGRVIDGRVSVNAGLEGFVAANTSLEGIFGYHSFKSVLVGNPHTWQLSANVKQYFGPGPLHVFVNGGIGAYRFDPGSTTKFGGNVGAGLLYDLSSVWGVEGVYNFHAVDTSGSRTQFSTLQVGIRHRVF